MAVGHSDDIDPGDAVAAVLEQCDRSLDGARATAGLLFSTSDTDLVPIVAGVRRAYPDIQLVGSTSAGEMSSVLGFQEDSVHGRPVRLRLRRYHGRGWPWRIGLE